MRAASASGIGEPGSRARGEEQTERGPVDVLHGDEVAALGLAEVEDLHQVRVVELRRELRLVEEHLDELRVLRQVREDALDDQQLLEAHRPVGLGEEHLGHAAGGELAEQLVLPQSHRAEALPHLAGETVATVHTDVEVDGRTVRISNPDKVFFSARGETKLDLVRYYLAVGAGALRGVRERPTVLKRYPDGAGGEFFYQKRVPAPRPEWLETVTVTFPSGRSAEELCPVDVAHLVWAVNLGCLDLNPWAVRGATSTIRTSCGSTSTRSPACPSPRCAGWRWRCSAVLEELGLVGWPKTSGSRGIHIYVRIEPRWDFLEVRRAALALAREVERRLPGHRHQQVVEGGARHAGLHRLQPERARPHHRLGLLGAGQPRGAGELPAHLGRGADGEPGGPDPRHGAGPLRPARRRWARASTTARSRSSRCSSSPTGTRRRDWATHPGRRTSRSRAASRSGCSRAGAEGAGRGLDQAPKSRASSPGTTASSWA